MIVLCYRAGDWAAQFAEQLSSELDQAQIDYEDSDQSSAEDFPQSGERSGPLHGRMNTCSPAELENCCGAPGSTAKSWATTAAPTSPGSFGIGTPC